MREVCQTWREEFELSVTKVVIIGVKSPPPPPSFSNCFPNLTSLDIGQCRMCEAGLGVLAGLKKVVCLNLGTLEPFGWHLTRNLTSTGLALVCHLPLTSLDLTGCAEVNDTALGCLQKLPLTRLNLVGCKVRNSSSLLGLPLSLTDLNLDSCGIGMEEDFRSASLEAISGMSLTRLNLGNYTKLNITTTGHIIGLPITDLDLSWCNHHTVHIDPSIFLCLRDMPLKRLVLTGCNVTDEGIAHLRGLHLEGLGLDCTYVTDALSTYGECHL